METRKKIVLLFLGIFALKSFLTKQEFTDLRYKAYQEICAEEDAMYDQGHHDSWNHKKPCYKDDRDYMEGYRDGKKDRPY